MSIRLGILKAAVVLVGFAAASAFGAQKVLTIVENEQGSLFADLDGFTLYTFDVDVPGQSNCNGPCAVKWPPALLAADAVLQAPFSVVTRADGSKQLAYKDQPLYRFQSDTQLGDALGDGLGGVWHVVKLP